MSHARFDQAARESLAECVKEIENRTDAEVVIIVRARSGHYAHADYLFGFLLTFAALAFLLFSPFTFHLYWVPIDILLFFVLGSIISSRSNFLRRLLSRKEFRSKAVRTAAAAMFYEAGIANTNAEMGVLIYLSLLERRLELIADRGVLKGIPAQEWNREISELRQTGKNPEPQLFLTALQSFGKLLATHLPPTGENPNELPDMPQFDLK
jgi:putative membrane protein